MIYEIEEIRNRPIWGDLEVNYHLDGSPLYERNGKLIYFVCWNTKTGEIIEEREYLGSPTT